MDIISRLKYFMEISNITSSQLADSAGIPRPTLSQLLNGRNKSNEGAKKVSSDIIRKIHLAFPNLNIMWLLFGDGDMESDSNIEISEPEKTDYGQGLSDKYPDTENIQKSLDFENFPLNYGAINLNSDKNTIYDSGATKSRPFESDKIRSEAPSENSTVKQNEKSRHVESIMVFYSDNSFEIFKPAK